MGFLFCHSPIKRRFKICSASPSWAEWRRFLIDGCTLLANSYLAYASAIIQPIVTARLGGGGGQAGVAALGARTILTQVGNYPATVAAVVSQVIMVLGAKYLGEASRRSITVYLRFVRNIFLAATLVTAVLSVGFFFFADAIYRVWTSDAETLKLCHSVTPLIVYNIASSIATAVVSAMLWSAQEFQWITAINIGTEYTCYVPMMALVESNVFGEISLFQLQLPQLVQSIVSLLAQLVLLWFKVLPRWRNIQRRPEDADKGSRIQ
eukprot:COSAG01_NODE_7476_length_3195_cov_4.496770_2_plen_265_part_00